MQNRLCIARGLNAPLEHQIASGLKSNAIKARRHCRVRRVGRILRVHNSGHWTIEGAVASQFENHIRAIAGLPLGSTATRQLPVVMRNLIGADIAAIPALLADRNCHVHHYSKTEVRNGRKLGHATWAGAAPGASPA